MNRIIALFLPVTARKVQLAVAILGTVGTACAAISGAISPSWALVVASLGAGAYAISRGLAKAKDGQDLKAWLRSTETWGVLLPLAADILAAVAGVIPLEQAGPIALIGPLLLRASRILHAARLPKVEEREDTVTEPATPKAKAEESKR